MEDLCFSCGERLFIINSRIMIMRQQSGTGKIKKLGTLLIVTE